MTATIGYATLQIIPSAKGALGDLQSELGGPLDDAGAKAGTSSSKKFSDKFTAGMKAATAAIGAAAVGAFVKSAIGAASDVEESMSKVKVVFGESSDSVIAWSKNAADAMGQSQGQALEAAGSFGNLFAGFGIGNQKSTEMSESMVQLATDLASFNNTSVDEALDALKSGLTGETEPLKKFGVALNDAAIKAEAVRLGLIATTNDALTPAQKAQASYSLILANTTTAQGDFARTSGGLANQQKILAAKFEDVKAKLGAVLLPIITKVAAFLSGHMTPVMIALGVVAAILFAAWVAGAISAAAATLAAAAPFIAIGLVIAAVAAGVIYAYTHWQVFHDVVDAIASFFRDTVWPIIQTVATGIADAFLAMVNFIRDHWEQIKAVIQAAITVVQTIIQTVIDAIQAAWQLFGDNILAAIQLAWDYISGVVQVGVDLVKGIIDLFISIFTGDWQGAWDAIKAILQAVWDGIKLVVQTAVDALKLVLDTAWDGIKAAAGLAWDGIKAAIMLPIDAAKAAIGLVWDGIKSAADTAWSTLKTAASTAWELIKTAVTAPIDAAKTAISTVWDTIVSTITGLPLRIASAAGGMWDGIKDAFKKVLNVIIGFWNSLDFTFTIPEITIPTPPGMDDWHIGGQTITFGVPDLPTFKTGGIASSPMLALVGDAGMNNPEIIAPQKMMAETFMETLKAWDARSGPQITLNNNRRDIGVGDLNQVLAMARLAS